jgi:hypothetical protein
MLYTGYLYLTDEGMEGAFERLGFPGYFRIELGIAKILGALVLIIPVIPKDIRQFAYFGFALTFISACIAHLSIGDGVQALYRPLMFLALLLVSYFLRKEASTGIGFLRR